MTAKLTHDGSGYAMTEARIRMGQKTICDASLTLRILDFPDEEMKLAMRRMAEKVGFGSEVSANG